MTVAETTIRPRAEAAAAPRFRFIEGLRGIAVIAVVLQHGMEEYCYAAPATTPDSQFVAWLLVRTIYLGRFGVVLFFMISGFVVPFSMRGPTPIRHFVVSRLFRLYPAYWLCILLAIAIGSPRAGQTFTLTGDLLNLTMVARTLHAAFLYGHFWTLEVEIAFYALCVLAYPLGLLTRPGTAFALLVATLAAGLLPLAWQIHHGQPLTPRLPLLAFQPYLLLGTLTRLTTERRAPGDLALLGAAVLLVALATPVGAGLVWPLAFVGTFTQPGPTSVGALLGLAAFLLALRWRRPTGPVAAWLGKVSYSTYLFHWPLFVLLLRVVPGVGARLPVLLVAGLTLTLLVAALVYRVVEQPMIALGRRLAGRSRERLAAEVAP